MTFYCHFDIFVINAYTYKIMTLTVRQGMPSPGDTPPKTRKFRTTTPDPKIILAEKAKEGDSSSRRHDPDKLYDEVTQKKLVHNCFCKFKPT